MDQPGGAAHGLFSAAGLQLLPLLPHCNPAHVHTYMSVERARVWLI